MILLLLRANDSIVLWGFCPNLCNQAETCWQIRKKKNIKGYSIISLYLWYEVPFQGYAARMQINMRRYQFQVFLLALM